MAEAAQALLFFSTLWERNTTFREFGRQAISCRKAKFKMLTASFLSVLHFSTSLNEGMKLDYL